MSENWKIGDIIEDQYEIVQIKRGGMGIVFLCFDPENKMPYAIKTFKDEYLGDKNAVERFKWEAETWVRLEKHRNIVRAYRVDNINKRPYIFLEMVVGEKRYGATLRGWIGEKALDIKTSLEFAVQFCLGMEHATKKFGETGKTFVHRDIKPENIMVTFDKIVKVTDFGIVKTFASNLEVSSRTSNSSQYGFTVFGGIYGTPPYMSPEQCSGMEGIDVRSDIYSFGCVLYEMLTGRPPFLQNAVEKYLKSHMEEMPENLRRLNPNIPENLGKVVMCCLEKDRNRRCENFTKLKEMLKEIYYDYGGEELFEKSEVEKLTEYEMANKGKSFAVLEKHEEALKCYDQIILLNPFDYFIWIYKSESLAALGMKDEVLKCYHKVVHLNPLDYSVWGIIGSSLLDVKENEEALKCFDRAIEFKGEDYLLWYCKSSVLFELGRHEEAIKGFDQTIRLNPNYCQAWYTKGAILYKLRRCKEAIECYDQALNLNPGDYILWHAKGRALAVIEKHKEAIDIYDWALYLNSGDYYVWYAKGRSLAAIERLEEAIECYEQTLRLNPEYYDAWYSKGRSLAAIGRREEAIECYDWTLQLNPEYDDAWLAKGIVLSYLGREEEAIVYYDRTLQLNPKYDDAWLAKGIVLSNLGRQEEAIECYDHVLQLNPRDYEAWCNKGDALLQVGRFEDALEVLRFVTINAPPQYLDYVNKIITEYYKRYKL